MLPPHCSSREIELFTANTMPQLMKKFNFASRAIADFA
jgi:hypothetical protein